MWLRLFLCPGLLAALIACTEHKDLKRSESPLGVVSTSLCGDSYIQTFAPNHIRALSWQSNSVLSVADKAQKELPQIDSRAENILPFRDSLILFGPGETSPVKNKLPFSSTLKWTETFEGVSENADLLLKALSLPTAPLNEWKDRVRTLKMESETTGLENMPPKILYLSRAGGSAGPNTFVDTVIHAAGGDNINPVAGWHTPDFETLLSYDPDIILRSFSGGSYHSRSDIVNPALNDFLSKTTVIDIDGKYWPCAGPGLLDAAEILQKDIQMWQSQQDA